MELTPEREALRDTVRAVLRRNPPDLSPAGDGPGYDQALWRLLGEVGVPGLGVPEERGGAGPARSRSASSRPNSAGSSLPLP